MLVAEKEAKSWAGPWGRMLQGIAEKCIECGGLVTGQTGMNFFLRKRRQSF